MNSKSILIVDDEKNIRLTLEHCLKPLHYLVESAVNGEEALNLLEHQEYHLILLDLKLPGMNGLEVLRKLRENHPQIKVVIITAHGTVEAAVEAMKLGAADFLQKPFAPQEIRDLVKQIFSREYLKESTSNDYASYLSLAKKYIMDRNFNEALIQAKKAIAVDPSQPEIFTLLGILHEIRGDVDSAFKNYRAAVSLDPSFLPAQESLSRIQASTPDDDIVLDYN